MNRFVPILIFASIILGGCYDSHEEPKPAEITREDNCNISHLRALCNEGIYLITTDLECIGRVTSSDQEGNFYRTIVIDDGSGGLEVKLGIYNSAAQYPVGLMVALHLNGTALMIENGVLQLGLPPYSHDDSPREMASQQIIDQHIARSGSVEPIVPISTDIASLDASTCGIFILVKDIEYAPLDDEEDNLLAGYSRFTDKEGNSIFVYVSPYADFAASEIPASATAIQGILYHEAVGMSLGKQFVIKPRFKDDISTSDSSF